MLYRLIQYLDNQLLNMSCVESGEDIHLERTTGCQPNSIRHNNYGRLLAQVEPTASSITKGNMSIHEHWCLNHFVY